MSDENKVEIPAKMMAIRLMEKAALYNSYMPFLNNGGLFVPTEDIFSLGDKVLLSVEIGDREKTFLRTQVAWINPARTSAQRPKGVGLAFSNDESCTRVKHLIETELGAVLRSDRVTFTL